LNLNRTGEAMQLRKIGSNILLWFVLITIGFAIGKEVTLRSVQKGDPLAPDAAPAPSATSAEKTIVYYMHGRVRCVTCNTIEKQAKELVNREFAKELQDGRLEWQLTNYEEREDLAKRYNVTSNGVVLAKLKNGTDVRSQVLEDVWTLWDERSKFDKYVADAIRGYLAPEAQK
jgi:hypothetical protein